MPEFRVGVTADLHELAERTGADVGLATLLTEPHVRLETLAATEELEPGAMRGLGAVLLLKPRITSRTLQGADQLTIVARWGVGVDNVDIEACTQHGAAVTITPDGVRRPVASAMLTLLLALAHNLVPKHRLLRDGRWDRTEHLGTGLTGRVLGLIGLGNIGREFLRLASPLGMRHLVFDPYAARDDAEVEYVDLPTLLRDSDFVCVSCPLTPETFHLLDAERLALLKPSACVINVARGPIIDQVALADALRTDRIRAAGLDVFEVEPLPSDASILALDNVIVSPHSLAWTDELIHGNSASACSAIIDLLHARVPNHVINPSALEHPRLRRMLAGRV